MKNNSYNRVAEKVEIDYEKLYAFLKAIGMPKEQLSYELGKSHSFIHNLRRSPMQPLKLEEWMCEKLGVERGFFIKKGNEPPVFETVTKKQIDDIGRVLLDIKETLDKILTELT